MQGMIRLTSPALLVLLLGIPAAAQEILVGGGGGSEVDGYAIHSGAVHIVAGQPGVTFGAVRTKADGEREFTYLVLFKHNATDGSQVNHSSQTQTGGGETIDTKGTHDLEIGGGKLSLAHELRFDPATQTTKSESLTINGKAIDLKDGRLFLVDLTGEKVTIQQVKAKLPGKLPNIVETDGVRETVKRVLAELPPESKEVREFLK